MNAGSTISLDEAFHDAIKRFQTAGIDSARLDARVLLGFVLGGGAERVLAESGRDMTPTEARHLETSVQRRLTHEPISQILGVREFWSLPFKVTPATLTPRPDTETVVEAALAGVCSQPLRVLDLGTGSGCILLALMSEWDNALGIGVDMSQAALDVATENACTLGFEDRARFILCDWNKENWTGDLVGSFDVVVSNPPYILDGDMAGLEPDVRVFEPLSALAGGSDGLNAYRVIVDGLADVLAPGGLIVFEVGVNQAPDVADILSTAGLTGIEQRRDLAGIFRTVMGRMPRLARGGLDGKMNGF